MRDGAPVRFIVLLLGGWTCLRIAMTAPAWWNEESIATAGLPALQSAAAARPAAAAQRGAAAAELAEPGAAAAEIPAVHSASDTAPGVAFRLVQRSNGRLASTLMIPAAAPLLSSPVLPPDALTGAAPADPAPAPMFSVGASGHTVGPARRWSGSAWLLARRDDAAALALGGTLGGSQAGARLLYRLNHDPGRALALSGRVYSPLRDAAAAEAALGLDWRPSRRLPLHLLAERRQRLGRNGRSALALTAYGGGGADLGRGWRLDGYAQAGMVGARSRDSFVDGSARISRAVGPFETGVGIWGAAQPGVSRVDVGAQLAVPIRAVGTSLRLAAEYRYRIAGNARPSSGPALTLGVDF